MASRISSDRETTAKRIASCSVLDDVTGCWNWSLSSQRNGYGQIKHGGKMKRAHRVSYEAFFGEIPAGAEVMHDCDNRMCVNPKHLTAGSHAENMKDMHAKGRVPSGPKHPNFGVKREAASYRHLCKPVVVDGIEYKSIRSAERNLGLSNGAIRYRLTIGTASYSNKEHSA